MRWRRCTHDEDAIARAAFLKRDKPAAGIQKLDGDEVTMMVNKFHGKLDVRT